MVDEYKRARRDLQTIFFSLPNILVICVGYSLTVKNIHTKKHFFRAKKARRRNVVLFPLKRGNKRHLQKLCVQVHCSYNTQCGQSFLMKSLMIPLWLFPQSYYLFFYKSTIKDFFFLSVVIFHIFQDIF